MSLVWNDDRLEALRDLWSEGFGQREIARQLGVSVGTAIGKISRLINAGVLVARDGIYRPRTPPPPKVARVAPFEKPVPPPPEPEVHEPLLVDGKPITIRTCSDRHCRYPFGEASADMAMCGRPPKPGMIYCGYHCKVCHQPQPAAHHRQAQAEKSAETAS